MWQWQYISNIFSGLLPREECSKPVCTSTQDPKVDNCHLDDGYTRLFLYRSWNTSCYSLQNDLTRYQFHQHFMSSFCIRKCLVQLFVQFGFVIFWATNIGAKAARIMLLKLIAAGLLLICGTITVAGIGDLRFSSDAFLDMSYLMLTKMWEFILRTLLYPMSKFD